MNPNGGGHRHKSKEELIAENNNLRVKLSMAKRFAERLSDGWKLTPQGGMTNKGMTKKHPEYDGCYCAESLKLLRAFKSLDLQSDAEKDLIIKVSRLEYQQLTAAEDFASACKEIARLEGEVERLTKIEESYDKLTKQLGKEI